MKCRGKERPLRRRKWGFSGVEMEGIGREMGLEEEVGLRALGWFRKGREEDEERMMERDSIDDCER